MCNARDAPWIERDGRGARSEFEAFDGANESFAQLGINIQVLGPGEPMAMYHWEADQEDFLVLAGTPLLIVEGEERPLRPWDFVHCPPGASHVLVGAGDSPSVIVAVGAREHQEGPGWGAYPVDETAQRHGASVDSETNALKQAYARFGGAELTRYRESWLPSDLVADSH